MMKQRRRDGDADLRRLDPRHAQLQRDGRRQGGAGGLACAISPSISAPSNIRVNAISAGPVRTLAGAGITDARIMFNHQKNNAPLRRNVAIEEIGNTAVYLLSDLVSAVTGEIHFVDSGYNIIAMPRLDELKAADTGENGDDGTGDGEPRLGRRRKGAGAGRWLPTSSATAGRQSAPSAISPPCRHDYSQVPFSASAPKAITTSWPCRSRLGGRDHARTTDLAAGSVIARSAMQLVVGAGMVERRRAVIAGRLRVMPCMRPHRVAPNARDANLSIHLHASDRPCPSQVSQLPHHTAPVDRCRASCCICPGGICPCMPARSSRLVPSGVDPQSLERCVRLRTSQTVDRVFMVQGPHDRLRMRAAARRSG